MISVPTDDSVSSRHESAPSAARPERGRLRLALLASTALVALTGLAPAISVADTGNPCVMVGQGSTCSISSTGAPATPASGDGGNGGPGNQAPALSSTLINPFAYEDDAATLISPINMFSGGSPGAPGNANTGGANFGQGGSGGQGGNGGDLTLFVDSAGHGTKGTIISGASGSVASGLTLGSNGGEGGGGALGLANGGTPGTSASGGDGGAVTASIGGNFVSGLGKGADIWSFGGIGGLGASGTSDENKFGVNGGLGGNGGPVGEVRLYGYFQGQSTGVHVSSTGGDGGKGGDGDSTGSGQGGNGGPGGHGGPVTVVVEPGAQIIGYGSDNQGAGLWVQSLGGQGGQGGDAEIGGTGGGGGNADSVDVDLNGQVSASGGAAPAVLVQSLGNVGGNGGHASDWTFNPTGGAGNNGGTPDLVTVTGNGAVISAGTDTNESAGTTSPGVLAQSIGGSGGIGADSTGIFAVGGAGGAGVAGSKVSIDLTNSTVTSHGFGSAGLQAQSIGGGGGKGGDATSSGVHSGAGVNMTIGGTGGGGGAGDDANVANAGGSVTTTNQHSPGLVIQSIGGGGGDGGAAYSTSYSTLYGASISVGGNGGAGGDGGTVNAANLTNNSGQVVTKGSDSFGMLGQSIGGGGGSGGASTAKSVVKSPDDTGGLSLALATGGTGGSGGSSSSVFLQNTGLIATQGAGAVGIIAQSIGGGGGAGGDASASSSASGGDFDLSASVAHGGAGGGGGSGGDTRGENHGLVITTGESADGMLVQSIGGGGGAGGAGDAKSSTGADKSLTVSLSMGGSGGGGGDGYDVSANNAGTIITLGDGAAGMVEQTIGGGGGRGGGAAGSTSGKLVSAQVILGGSGGDGGGTWVNGSSSQATNSGTILTFGADATGILAQSIGGGGGAGGKAGTNLGTTKSTGDGGNGGANNAVGNKIAQVAADFASNRNALGNYSTIQQALSTANAMLGNGSLDVSDDDDIGDDLDNTSGSVGETEDDNKPQSIALNVVLGGAAGAGGAAGNIIVTNTGTVATMGRHADGIVAQSIGGGGGKGGAASTASSDDISGNVAVGGGALASDKTNANNGGQSTVNNAGQIYTMGPLSAGIVAQSIAGGGGIGGSSSATSSGGGNSDEPSVALDIAVGGGSGSSGSISMQSEVTNSGAIQTRGHDSIGIIAQSIAGGGGIVKTLATNLDNQGGSANASSSKDFAADIQIGNHADTSSGKSGAVSVVTLTGSTITTVGDNSYGILAQSIAGSGGVALGGKPNGSSASEFFGDGKMTGDVNANHVVDVDQNQGVQVEVGDTITTAGKGGVGVFAQSIGGGGGISGDTGWTMSKSPMGRNGNHTGDGGDIAITVGQGATITTTSGSDPSKGGGNAPGIVAQSIGGGGGWFTNKNGAFIGSAGGAGKGGTITLNIQGSIDAQGPASPGILTQSVGGGSNGGSGSGQQIAITIGSASNTGVSVTGGNNFGDDAAAVYIDHGGLDTAPGSANTLTNYGTIASHQGLAGTAVYGFGGYTNVTNNGTISGQIKLGSQTGTDTFTWGSITNNGTINSGTEISLGAGTLTNDGKLSIGGDGQLGTTRLMGNFVQGPSGTLALDADHATKRSDRLEVTGDAEVGGKVAISSPTLTRDPLTILHGTGAVTLDPALAFNRTHVLSYTPQVAGGGVVAVPKADFHGTDGSLAGNREAVAQHLQQVFDRGEDGFGAGLAGLAADQDGGRFGDRLDSLTGETLAALGGLQMQSGRSFRSGLYSCPTFGDESVLLGEQDCGWGQVTGSYADQNGSGSNLGYDVKSLATQFGGQKQIAEGWFLGGSLAYQRSDLESDHNLTDIDGDGVLAGLVLKHQTGPLTLSMAADGGYGWYDSKRRIDLATGTENAKASPEAGNAGLHARASYELPFDRWYLKPSFEVGADYIRTGSFKEHGASPFDLDVDSADKVILSATPGIELGGRIDLAGGSILRPHLELGLTATTANNWKPDARFKDETGGDGFRIESKNPNLIGHLGVGIDMITTASVDIKLQYGLDVASDYTANSGMLKVAYRF